MAQNNALNRFVCIIDFVFHNTYKQNSNGV